jgi:hypothetical protein
MRGKNERPRARMYFCVSVRVYYTRIYIYIYKCSGGQDPWAILAQYIARVLRGARVPFR